MSTAHERLFSQYVKALREARDTAERWWNELIARESRLLGSEAAVAKLKRRWRVGPAAHPRVIAVIRKFYFACEQLNSELEATPSSRDDAPVPPQVFVTEWLLDEDNEALADFIDHLTYWPIGRDRSNNAV